MAWTLDMIAASDMAVLTPRMAADVLGCDPHWIRVAAKDAPDLLHFPVLRVGNRVKIPRIPFLRFMGVEISREGGVTDGIDDPGRCDADLAADAAG